MHHTYANSMCLLWAHSSDAVVVLPEHGLSDAGVVEAILNEYSGDGICTTGVRDKIFVRGAAESCDGFHSDIRRHCGKQNYPQNRR